MTTDARQYKHAPIREAICEFHFAPKELDFSFQGDFYRQIKSDYPEKPIIRTEQRVLPGGINQILKNQFSSADRTRLTVTGQNTLSVHVLAPYPGWTTFYKQIAGVYQVYQSLAEAPLVGIVLRYLNGIELKVQGLNFREYFSFIPGPIDGIPDQVAGFLAQAQLPYKDGPYTAAVTFTSSPPPEPDPERVVVILDVSCLWQAPEPGIVGLDIQPGSEVGEVVLELRKRQHQVFEALITNKARELFDE